MSDAVDRELRDSFARLRQEDAGGAPQLAGLLSAARRRGSAGPPAIRWAPVLTALALAVALVAVTVLAPDRPRQPLVDLAAARWQGPTDFLLQVPGAKYLETVPTLTAPWRNP